MADLISLFRYNQNREETNTFLPYVIFQTGCPQLAQSLSPDVMKITDSLYVADLAIVESYWEQVAKNRNLSVYDQLEKVVEQQIPDCQLSLFCEHPFQGLVFYNHLQQLGSLGSFKSNSLFSKKIYQHMGWQPWFISARQVQDCFEREQCLKKERQNFSSQLGKLSRFVNRLDMQDFAELKQAHFFELSRRFKGFIGLLWKWTFPQESQKEEEPSLFTFSHYQRLKGFPWVPFFNDDPPQVETLLEFPVSEWDAIKEFLFYDLGKLSQDQKLSSPYKVLQIKWSLTLFDMSAVEETLQFKSPICLSEERDLEFATLMKQLQFSFESFSDKLKERDQELEMINTHLIVGWTLQVQKRMILSEKSDFLDLEEQVQKLHKKELLNITNKVKTGLQSFKVFETFIPGFDFSGKPLLEEVNEPKDFLFNGPRPFYLFPEELEFSKEDIKSSQFLDRTSSDWWNRKDTQDSFRDCFLCELKNKEFIFAYRNYQGKWYRYGV